jgi:hypothetical protein
MRHKPLVVVEGLEDLYPDHRAGDITCFPQRWLMKLSHGRDVMQEVRQKLREYRA